MDLFADVKEFHAKFGVGYDGLPRFLPKDLYDFRLKFLREEITEWEDHHNFGKDCLHHGPYDHPKIVRALEGTLDAMVDEVYVALGTALLQGFDFNEAWKRVHAANMAKVRCTDASQSKRGSTHDVIKPPGWVAPSHIDLVSRNAYTGE